MQPMCAQDPKLGRSQCLYTSVCVTSNLSYTEGRRPTWQGSQGWCTLLQPALVKGPEKVGSRALDSCACIHWLCRTARGNCPWGRGPILGHLALKATHHAFFLTFSFCQISPTTIDSISSLAHEDPKATHYAVMLFCLITPNTN